MSVGHVSRAFEDAGIATVIIAATMFAPRMEMMSVPRVVLTRELMGRPLGDPGDRERQMEILQAALDLLSSATANGAVTRL
ncbi:MAG: hypothetical protein MI747_02435 [Desulfobacterales bacterium]|nr:hypothetical protein [Desulfobacterales bacterium]